MDKNFKKLEEYLLNLKGEDVLCWDENKSYVDMSWIFLQPLDKKLVQKALANIMKLKNSNYFNRAEQVGKEPEDIPGFHIIRAKERLIFRANGVDGWTKLNIASYLTEGDNTANRIPTITFDDLIEEVKNIISNNRKVTSQESDFLIMGIKSAFSKSFENFVDYYQYLLEEKKEAQKHKCIIQPRQDNGSKHNKGSGVSVSERKSPIIDFIKRDEFLKSKNPYTSVEVEEIGKDGTIIPNSYTVYVYKDLLKEIGNEQKGFLFVCEPLGGDRTTRLMYISEEEFNQMEIEKSGDKFSKIVKKYLDMSNEEFRASAGTYTMTHTEFDSYKERIEFFLEGTKGKSLTNLKQYKKSLEELYQKEEIELPYYKAKTKEDISKIGESTSYSQIDRTAQAHVMIGEKSQKENKYTDD